MAHSGEIHSNNLIIDAIVIDDAKENCHNIEMPCALASNFDRDFDQQFETSINQTINYEASVSVPGNIESESIDESFHHQRLYISQENNQIVDTEFEVQDDFRQNEKSNVNSNENETING